MRRGLVLSIDLDAAGHNLKTIQKHTGGSPVIAVVKADAYGHGAIELSRAFINAGAKHLAVAFISEARRLRDAGISAPILVLFDKTEIGTCFDLSLTPVIHDLQTAIALDQEARTRNTAIDVHIKVDTGMGRMGFTEGSSEDIQKVTGLGNIRIVGLMSHFADADLEDRSFSLDQINKFKGVVRSFNDKGISPLCHISNSAASLSLPEAAFDAVRPGIALYGVSPFREKSFDLKPVLSVKAPIISLRRLSKGQTISYGRTFTATRDMTAAVIAAGYADGYIRSLSNRAKVIVKGKLAPVAGRVCMDLCVADVTEIEEVSETDMATLLGSDGNENISAWDLAEMAGTIPYEILTSMGRAANR